MLLAVCRLEELEKCKTIAINRSRKIVENIYLDGFDIKKSSFSNFLGDTYSAWKLRFHRAQKLRFTPNETSKRYLQS